MTLSTWISLQFTGHVINEPRNGLFLWLTGRLRKPPLKWHRRLKNSHNTTVQLQTLIGSRDNRIRYLVKFNNLKQCMCARFATALIAPVTPFQSSSLQSLSAYHCYAQSVLNSTEPQTERNPKSEYTKPVK